MITKNGRTGVYLTDYKDLITELNRVQPTVVKQLQRDYRSIAKPVQTAVKSNIPASPPTSGLRKSRPQASATGFYPIAVPGRLTWGANNQNKNKPVKSVLIETPSVAKAAKAMRKSGTGVASIARLRVDNAAVVLADMAGKTGKNAYSRKYKYMRNGVIYERKHRLNGQGRAMLRALPSIPSRVSSGKAHSRFVWPAAERAIPKTYVAINDALTKAYSAINRRMAS